MPRGGLPGIRTPEIKAAARLAVEQTHQEPELAGAMFEIAQWALSSKAAYSLAQMAARQAKGDGALASMVRERQDLAGEWQARDKLLIAAIAQSPDQRNASAEQVLRDHIAKIDVRITDIDKTLAAYRHAMGVLRFALTFQIVE